MLVLDANALIRYILQDNIEMADTVERELATERCFLPIEVVSEIIYVLVKLYGVEREVAADTMKQLLKTENIVVSEVAVLDAGLSAFAQTKLDFVDCLLAGYVEVYNWRVLTFDKALLKYVNQHPSNR
ncbi:MAG: PIN domain-containing protein [Oscillospiraceae bacterium]|jgi:predicted nucleic-acid-binding protein|nr:PIN domain-containing protein [Oscillospiraceae bacterium]